MHDREHQLTAWTEAFPLLSIRAFCAALDRLEDDSPSTSALSAEHELWVRARARGLSLDGIEQVRDRAWFFDSRLGRSRSRSLTEYVLDLAQRYLRSAGTAVTLAPTTQLTKLASIGAPTDTPSLARRWRLLSLSLPEDLLVAAITVVQMPREDPPSDHVELLPPHAAKALTDPCAETHVHISASMSFAQLWAGWIGAGPLSDNIAKSRNHEWPLDSTRDRFAQIALACAIVRLMLASFLRSEQARDASSLSRFAPLVAAQWSTSAHRDAGAALAQCTAMLVNPSATTIDVPLARRAYRALISPRPRASTVASHQELDPLYRWLPAASSSPETRFTAHALRYMLRATTDSLFAKLFWQYTRVRAAIFDYLTLEAGTSGLHWFSTHARRGKTFTDPIDRYLTQFATTLANSSLTLGSFEGRTNFPQGGRVALQRTIRRFAQGAILTQNERRASGSTIPLEVGLVLHFRKDNESPSRRRGARSYGAKCHPWLRSAWKQTNALCDALERDPRRLIALRGVDLCGRELTMPNWPALGPMQQARRSSYRAAAQLRALEPQWDAAPLALTVHAGEEYRRIVEGLRRIDEFLRWAPLEAGDRIGHALALADAPDRRFAVGSRAMQPRVERLDDLLWEHDLYARGIIAAPAGRSAFVQEEILRLAREIYGNDAGSIPVSEHGIARELRFDPAVISALDIGVASTLTAPPLGPLRSARDLLRAYLFDPAVYERGEPAIEVAMDAGEAAFALEAQRMLRTTIAHQQITIESNPSCNHLVADLDGLDQHPALALQPLPSQQSELPPVLLSINTDNPIVFATRLADEYAHIYYALIRAGVSSQEALVWLEQVRTNGYRSRFTVASSADPNKLAKL